MSEESLAVANQSVTISVKILDELAAYGQPIGVSELARRMNESKGRIHRHLTTLRALGLVSQQPVTERYGLGWKIFQLGSAANDSFGIRRIAEEHISRLRDETQHTTVFAIPANREALVLTSAMSNNRITIMVKHGVTLSATASALGRVVLAFSSPAMQEAVITGPLVMHTEASLTEPEMIVKRFEVIQKRFYEVAVNENTYGISTLAAPVFDEQGHIAGSVGIVGSPYTIPKNPGKDIIAQVQNCAKAMSEALGSTTWQSVKLSQP